MDILLSTNLSINRLFREDKSFFVDSRKSECNGINVWTLIPLHSLWRLSTLNDLSCLNTSAVMERFVSLIGWPLPVKLKLQMYSMTQLFSVDVVKFVENAHKFTHVHSLFVSYKILLVLTEQSIYGKVPTSLACPLMLRTNNTCVQSLNISVDVA